MAIPTDIQQQVYDLLSQASNLSFVSAEQEQGARVGFIPGQRVTAEVLSTLSNNLTQVQIGTERFNLELPMAVRPGQTLEMTYVTDDPRSTFAIARQGGLTPPVSLSDASRLLSLLIGSEQISDPKLRSSLQSIGDMLRRSAGESGVLANLMDEALTYGALRDGGKGSPQLSGGFVQQHQGEQVAETQAAGSGSTPEQARISSFEANAAQILQHVARNSRFILTESANQPVVPLPLVPGEEVDAAVIGTLPGGRVFVQVTGTSLELIISRTFQAGDILRLTFISSQPKPLFALQRVTEGVPSTLSEAGRWMSVLEHSEGGISKQQLYVLEQLDRVLKNLPPNSPAFTAIQDEAITYQTVLRDRRGDQPSRQGATVQAGATVITPQQFALLPGNGIVLSDDMAKLLQALIKGNRLALLEAINQQVSSPGFLPGQQIKGEVIAALGGGRFMVQVADQSLVFSMPEETSRGERINLFFIAGEPHPTFLMTRLGRPGDASVSETGRWLSGFLSAATERVPALETLGILKTLLSDPPTDASLVSRVLQQGLRESGLFYESHLARWFGGEYPLEDILREPQGKLSPLRQLPVREAGNPVEEMARAGMKNGSVEVMEAMLKKAGTSMAHEGIVDQHALPVVREQLSTLQSGHIFFRGDLIPGQQMEWTVRERDARRTATGEQERSWETSLSVDMPKLGRVNARLKLDGNRVSVELRPANPESEELLGTAKNILAEQLEAAGLVPAEIGIIHEIP